MLVKEPLHREEQLKAIENCIKLAEQGKQEHLFLFGPAGSGKTFCVLYALSKYKPKFSYVDCYTYKTRSAIITKILNDFGFPISRRGVPLDYLFEKLDSLLKKQRGIVIVLDGIHKIDKKEIEIFNDILKINDNSKSISLIIISLNESILDSLYQSILNAFLPIKVRFPAYTKDQLIDILNQEIEAPFDALELRAEYACNHNGNCRLALECLKRIAQRPEGITLTCTLKFLNELRY